MNEIMIRRSCRNFLDKEIEQHKIENILKAAMQAPSAVNQQPWSFLVIRNKENIQALTKVSPGAKVLTNANVAICLMIDSNQDKRSHMWPQDMSAAMQNMLLQATSEGLGSCWIGIYPNMERIIKVSQTLNLPSRYIPFSLCALGYPASEDANKFIDRYDASRVFYEEVK